MDQLTKSFSVLIGTTLDVPLSDLKKNTPEEGGTLNSTSSKRPPGAMDMRDASLASSSRTLSPATKERAASTAIVFFAGCGATSLSTIAANFIPTLPSRHADPRNVRVNPCFAPL
eukprot:CAMPEP_0169387098 /NCGR_PEP_ID=MMETSP1017-20121227/45166_1 /TAXON_ID=342587 /ORGANISM="Karlodinium micrum, Strain CCMP2283" /LENGTH=114 /DNA_ID=CAMNT_0009488473 /DNA_START=800 /DNA_END=1144 /DNA_ORIENTATION=+